MNKAELVSSIAQNSGVSKRTVEKVLDATLESIIAELESGGKVQLVGFGSFEVKSRAGRTGRNLKTNGTVAISPKKSPVFKAGKILKDRVENGGV